MHRKQHNAIVEVSQSMSIASRTKMHILSSKIGFSTAPSRFQSAFSSALRASHHLPYQELGGPYTYVNSRSNHRSISQRQRQLTSEMAKFLPCIS